LKYYIKSRNVKGRNEKMAIRIFIEQGHNPPGYHNGGAVGNGLFEADINYIVGIYLFNLLNNDSRFEARVSRPTETTVLGTDTSSSLAARVNMANSWSANYFISIHCNSNIDPAINGTEAYIYLLNSEANVLSEYIIDGITQVTGTRDNGIYQNQSLYVLRNTAMPSTLIELGYLSNFNDAQRLRDFPYGFAYGIYLGLLNYFGLV
jgi:N-acetylmuramoyl-L-alanine amidase